MVLASGRSPGTGALTTAEGFVARTLEAGTTTALETMTDSELPRLQDHVVVLGYGDVTESLLDELTARTDVVVVTPDERTAASLDIPGVHVVTGDPTDEEVLADAGVDTAEGVVVESQDGARDVGAVLAARNVDPDVRVVAAASHERHLDKLASVGADELINPRTITGGLLGQSVLWTMLNGGLADP